MKTGKKACAKPKAKKPVVKNKKDSERYSQKLKK
jgi:hypothetical protein